MKYKNRKIIIALIFLLIFNPAAYSAEVLVDSGQRQTVLERTKQYAGKVDALDIRVNADLNFQKNLKIHSGGNTSGESAKCNGYTVSSCGIPCCGEQECKSVCTANMSIAHGNTCLSEYTTSPCGMSCCGKEDCDRVCYNYRASTVSTEACGGYIKTATGEACCGLEDCRQKNCNGYTSTTSADFGIEQSCCGKKNCEDVKCDYSHSTEVISGGTAKCCGTKDCYSKYCEGMTTVDSKVDPSKKNLECCGKENCHQVECDGYTQTNTPSGVRQCCGYEDCRDKECQYRRSATNQKGEKVACCGIEECGNIEFSRTYEEPVNKKAFGDTKHYNYNNFHVGQRSHGSSVSRTNHHIAAFRTVAYNVKAKVSTGVAKSIPKGCSQVSVTEYEGEKYYYYKCVDASSSKAPNRITLVIAATRCRSSNTASADASYTTLPVLDNTYSVSYSVRYSGSSHSLRICENNRYKLVPSSNLTTIATRKYSVYYDGGYNDIACLRRKFTVNNNSIIFDYCYGNRDDLPEYKYNETLNTFGNSI